MLAFVTGNLGTILITLFLVLIVALAIHTLVKDKRQGRSSCGGSWHSTAAAPLQADSGTLLLELLCARKLLLGIF